MIPKYEAERKPGGDHISFAGLVTRYLVWLAKRPRPGPRTKSDRRKYIDVARRDLGMMEVRAFESRRARGLLLEWRDKYASTPKTADERLGAVSKALQ